MTTDPMVLEGCAPAPLASYLKALGVLRLLASPSNHARGAAADPDARGWWEGARFLIATRLEPDGLLRFFLEEYAPSPIIAPWNGGSGFYPKDNRDGFGPLRGPVAPRFASIAAAISLASRELDRRSLTKRPEGVEKAALVAALRRGLPDSALDWLDATVVLSGDRLNFPQLLGTGGNDGRLDFTNNFMRRLVAPRDGLFDAATGAPSTAAERLLRASLDARPSQNLLSFGVGQFAPGAAGGANATVGYEGSPPVNPWDFVLALEGAVLFAGAATRRHQGSTDAGASFPFTVRATGAGWGGIADHDADSARAEFWAPLWRRPAGCGELAGLLREGRAILHGRTARDGLDFARAASSLGTSRGVDAFQRYGFVMRLGNMHLAAPLGSHAVSSRVAVEVRLIDDLDSGGWLRQIRMLARDRNAPARARQLLRQLDDALFGMTAAGAGWRAVQRALSVLGEVVAWLSHSPDARKVVQPPPRLQRAWAARADDGSAEFRVAAALAGIGWPTDSDGRARAPSVPPGTATDAPPAMATYFAPVIPTSVFARSRHWDGHATGAHNVRSAGDLVTNLNAVLERGATHASPGKLPTDAFAPVRLRQVAAFLAPGFDDVRCARLLAGLVWVRPTRLGHTVRNEARPPVPFAYAALKPIFTPAVILGKLARDGLVPPLNGIPLPTGLLGRLRSGDVDEAVRLALARAGASGIGSPFRPGSSSRGTTSFGVGLSGRRLAAALLIPLHEHGSRALLQRTYPTLEENEDVA